MKRDALETRIYSSALFQSFPEIVLPTLSNVLAEKKWELNEAIEIPFSKSISYQLPKVPSKERMMDDNWGLSSKEVQSLIS